MRNRLTQRAKGSRRRVLAGLALLVAPVSAVPGAVNVSVVRQTQVDLAVRLDVLPRPASSFAQTLTGAAGTTQSIATVLDAPGGPVRAFVAITPDPDQARERCRLRIVSEVRQGRRVARLDRTVEAAPERLGLIEIWSAPQGARLVLGYTASWAEKPRVVEIRPGTEPVDFAVEVALRTGEREQLLEERRLLGMVGSPVRYEYRRAGSGCGDAAPCLVENSTFRLDLSPDALDGDELDLGARLVLVTEQAAAPGDAPAEGVTPAAPARRDGVARARLAPGEPLRVALPLGTGGQSLVVRVTPWF